MFSNFITQISYWVIFTGTYENVSLILSSNVTHEVVLLPLLSSVERFSRKSHQWIFPKAYQSSMDIVCCTILQLDKTTIKLFRAVHTLRVSDENTETWEQLFPCLICLVIADFVMKQKVFTISVEGKEAITADNKGGHGIIRYRKRNTGGRYLKLMSYIRFWYIEMNMHLDELFRKVWFRLILKSVIRFFSKK